MATSAVQIHYTQAKRGNGGCWPTTVPSVSATILAARAYIAAHDLVPAGHVHHALHEAMGAETLLTYGTTTTWSPSAGKRVEGRGRGAVYGRLYAPRGAVRIATAALPVAERRRLLALYRAGGLASALLTTCSDEALASLAVAS